MNFYIKQLLIYLLVVLGYVVMGLISTDGRFIYPIDDAYIHLAISKNFALHHAWSINQVGFDSASSSILYTLLLSSLIKLFGVSEYYPLIINLIAGSATVIVFVKYLSKYYGNPEQKLGLFLLIPFTLLASMTVLGMEVTLQMFLTTTLFYFLKKFELKQDKKSDFLYLNLTLFFLSATRYETLFITAAIVFVFALNNYWKKIGIILFSSLLPITIFGLISLNQGGHFFPNTVLLKGNVPNGSNLFYTIFKGIFLNFSFYKWLLIPFLLLFIYMKEKYRGSFINGIKTEILLVIVVIMGLLHSIFAILELRYENYIMIALLLVIIPIIAKVFQSYQSSKSERKSIGNLIKFGLVIGIFFIAYYRFFYYTNANLTASRGVYQQQFEMGKFVKENYQNQNVAANDIGAIAYFGDCHLTDLVGLGTTEIATFIYENRFLERSQFQKKMKSFYENYAKEKHLKIAIIYPNWFEGTLPDNWIPVGHWTREPGYGTAQPTVVFYAMNNQEAKILRQKLLKFKLNPKVMQGIY